MACFALLASTTFSVYLSQSIPQSTILSRQQIHRTSFSPLLSSLSSPLLSLLSSPLSPLLSWISLSIHNLHYLLLTFVFSHHPVYLLRIVSAFSSSTSNSLSPEKINSAKQYPRPLPTSSAASNRPASNRLPLPPTRPPSALPTTVTRWSCGTLNLLQSHLSRKESSLRQHRLLPQTPEVHGLPLLFASPNLFLFRHGRQKASL